MRGPLPRPLPSLIPKNPQPEPWLELGGSVWGPGGQFRVGCGRAVPCWVRAGGSASAGAGGSVPDAGGRPCVSSSVWGVLRRLSPGRLCFNSPRSQIWFCRGTFSARGCVPQGAGVVGPSGAGVSQFEVKKKKPPPPRPLFFLGPPLGQDIVE